MSQAELARLLKVTPQTVNRILRTANVQTGTLERICDVLNLPITYFYDEDSEATQTVTVDEEEMDIDKVAKFWQTCHIGDKVRSLLRSQHKKMGAMCQYVGMTAPGMHRVFERDSCKINVLLKMSEYFNVPINYFLPEDKRAQEETEKDREIQYLKGQLKAYENTLATVLQGMKGAENVICPPHAPRANEGRSTETVTAPYEEDRRTVGGTHQRNGVDNMSNEII